MGGDGNCLFRSFSDQLEGNENNYKFFRTETVYYIIKQIKHMVENRDNFEPFIEDDQKFDAYIEEMSRDGKWGGNLEIQVIFN
jgi:OTU domain-containing protein 3